MPVLCLTFCWLIKPYLLILKSSSLFNNIKYTNIFFAAGDVGWIDHPLHKYRNDMNSIISKYTSRTEIIAQIQSEILGPHNIHGQLHQEYIAELITQQLKRSLSSVIPSVIPALPLPKKRKLNDN